MELRRLRYFVAVAEELHFGRAAQRLRIAQPPLSQQIRKLEDALGVKLFSRTKRHVELTYAGSVLLPEARQLLAHAERAAEAARRAERGQVGSLVVAVGPIAAHAVVPRVLPAFHARYPQVNLALRDYLMAEAVDALLDRRVDAALIVPYFHSELLKREIAVTIPLVAVLRKTHPLAGLRRLRLQQLAEQHFVLYSPRRSGYYEHVLALCRNAGYSPKVAQTAGQLPGVFALVAAGYGVSLIPAAMKALAPRGLVSLEFHPPRPTIEIAIAWRADNSSPVVAAFVDAVRSSFRAAPAAAPARTARV
jgi:DNA-binding transcriptional LysR family regulator